MKKRYIISAVLLLIVCGLIYNFYFKEKTIKVRKVDLQKIVVQKTVSGDIEVKSYSQANLAFGSTGKIQSISVKEGDSVKVGQQLAKLETGNVSQNIQAAKDARDITIRNKDLFLKQYQSSEAQESLGGKEEYNITLRKYDEEISRTEALYRAQLINTNDLYIKSPINGTVVSVSKDVGENISLNETLFTVADLNALYFETIIDQADFANIKTDQNAEIELDAYEEQILTAVVSKLPLAIEKGKDSFLVDLKFSDPQINVLYGMTGNGKITVAETENEVDALTFDQIFTDEDKKYYIWFINDQNKLTKKMIDIGLEGDIYTQILTNINNLQLVVPDDSAVKNIKEGQTVQIIES